MAALFGVPAVAIVEGCDAFGACVRFADVEQALDAHSGDLQRDARCPAGHVDAGAPGLECQALTVGAVKDAIAGIELVVSFEVPKGLSNVEQIAWLTVRAADAGAVSAGEACRCGRPGFAIVHTPAVLDHSPRLRLGAREQSAHHRRAE